MSTQYAEHNTEQPRGRKRKTATVAGIIAAAIAGAGGVALAAILLTTTISGGATVTTVNTANDLDVTASAVNGSQLDCTDIKVSDDNKSLVFNPKLTKRLGGTNADPASLVDGGSCVVTLAVKNTGDGPIRLDSTQTTLGAPAGWTITAFEGDAFSPIAKGQIRTVKTTLSATNAAVAGNITGKLVYTDAA